MERNAALLTEVMEEIESSLKDPKGVTAHQRRLAFCLSLGTVALIEESLVKKQVFKSGAKINHLWFKKKKGNVKILIARQITCPVENLTELDDLLSLAFEIERERNTLAYGKQATEEQLSTKIRAFLNLKRRVENA